MPLTRQSAINNLTGNSQTNPKPVSITEPGGGGKFAPDGRALPFPGNTIICDVLRPSRSFEQLVRLRESLKAQPFAQYFAFLPAPSFHMTVFEGVTMTKQSRKFWPQSIPEDANLEEVTDELQRRLGALKAPRITGIIPIGPQIHAGLAVRLEGANDEAKASLLSLREHYRDLMKINPPSFKSYQFHISLAYLLRWVSPEEAEKIFEVTNALVAEFCANIDEIELEPPKFCTFHTMNEFVPVSAR